LFPVLPANGLLQPATLGPVRCSSKYGNRHSLHRTHALRGHCGGSCPKRSGASSPRHVDRLNGLAALDGVRRSRELADIPAKRP